MNILFLLGNGFDRNLKMETAYEHFYKNAYQVQPDDNDLIKNLKLAIKNDVKTWADLELALGKHTKELKSREEFYLVFDDIRDKLSVYMSEQKSPYIFDSSTQNKFLNDMWYPYNFLAEGEKNTFSQLANKYIHNQTSISAISFNYTNSLEKILSYNNENIQIGTIGKIPCFFTVIEHIHGFTDERFVLGVDNIEQIANEAFRNDEEIVRSFVKPRLNKEAKHLVDERCKKMIDNAQIICLFGMSVGETDKTWWQYIGTLLQNGGGSIRLIIFWKDEEIHPRYIDKKLRVENEVRERFLSMTSLSDNLKKNISQYIYIAYNTKIFKMD